MQNFVLLLLEVMNQHLQVSKKFIDTKSPWIFIEFISHPLEVCYWGLQTTHYFLFILPDIMDQCDILQ